MAHTVSPQLLPDLPDQDQIAELVAEKQMAIADALAVIRNKPELADAAVSALVDHAMVHSTVLPNSELTTPGSRAIGVVLNSFFPDINDKLVSALDLGLSFGIVSPAGVEELKQNPKLITSILTNLSGQGQE